ncbi:response regulator [Cohnella sp.]|uniref:response regulator n=1 Tax=Cohnella sp. TaxID=1883426 RepID=UPI00356654F5
MKIKKKLLIGFSLILALFIGITSLGYERLNKMNQSMDHFYDNRFEKMRVAFEIRGEVNASARVIDSIVLGDQEPISGVDEITTRLKNAAKQYKSLSSIDLEPSEQEVVSGIISSSEGYGKSLKSFISFVNQGDVGAARKLYTDTLRHEQSLVIESLGGLVDFQETALKQEMNSSKKMYKRSVQLVAILTLIGLLLGLGIVLWVFPSITKGLNLLSRMADRFGKGRLRGFSHFEIKSTDELGDLAKVFKKIALDLQAKNEREAILSGIQQRQGRIDAQIARVTELLQEGSDVKLVAQSFISEFAPVLGASYGLLYLTDPNSSGRRRLELSGTYAVIEENEDIESSPTCIFPGEGLLGQSFRDAKPIILNEVPEGYVRISSGLGETCPSSLIIQPILHENTVLGIVELASISEFNSENIELLERLCEKLGTIVNNIHSRRRVEELLRESQAMTEELQAQSEELICQQEELRETNDKLEGQRNDLKNSELQLQQQQEMLEHTNRELTVKTISLEEYVDRMEQQNSQIAKANSELERQSLQLAMTSKYKSEFLANMSHELRTPLNSLLILSEFLAENKEGNLTDKQREYMRTIHYSGNDLLKMIDEILDLSKVDAGKMDIHPEWMVLNDVSTFLDHMYAPMASQKSLSLSIESEADIPNVIWTDGHRLKQILRNLMSNAIKFTDAGSITLTMRRPSAEEQKSDKWQKDVPYIAFSVRDSGIGIPPEKNELIFEAFHQADGTTSRKYGGTGLGLTISRELARLLGGWIHLETEVGKGSVFTLVLPERIQENANHLEDTIEPFRSDWAAVASDDVNVTAVPDAEEGFTKLQEEHYDCIVLDSNLPEDKRKLLNKPHHKDAAFENKKILLVDDDVRNVFALSSVLEHRQMTVIFAENGKEALSKLAEESDIDLVLMDIMMPEMDGYEAMIRIRDNADWKNLPIIALTAKAMKDDRSKCIEAGASDYITKPINTDQLLSLMRVWLYQ